MTNTKLAKTLNSCISDIYSSSGSRPVVVPIAPDDFFHGRAYQTDDGLFIVLPSAIGINFLPSTRQDFEDSILAPAAFKAVQNKGKAVRYFTDTDIAEQCPLPWYGHCLKTAQGILIASPVMDGSEFGKIGDNA